MFSFRLLKLLAILEAVSDRINLRRIRETSVCTHYCDRSTRENWRQHCTWLYREQIQRSNYWWDADETYVFSLLDAMGAVGNVKTLEIIQTNYGNIKGPLRNMLLHAMVQVIERCNLEYQFDHKVRNDLLQALHSDSQISNLVRQRGWFNLKTLRSQEICFSLLGISEEMDFVIIAQMSERPQVFKIAVECLEGGLIRGKIQIIMLLGKLAIEFIHSFKYYDNYPIGSGELNRAFAATAEFWREANQEDWEIIADTLFGFDCDRALEFLSSVIIWTGSMVTGSCHRKTCCHANTACFGLHCTILRRWKWDGPGSRLVNFTRGRLF